MKDRTVVHTVTDLLAQVEKTSACLIVLSGKATIGRMYKLDKPELIIGRGLDADILLEDDAISRKHARLVLQDGEVQLIDLGSTNGTFINGQRIQAAKLSDGDKIQIGTTTILKFSYQDHLDEALQTNLYESATHDDLTRVYNKKFFLDALQKEFSYCARHGGIASLVMVDIDHFKQINDVYGHQTGDYVLARMAGRVQETIRKEDVFARYGGEEFVLLLRQLPEDKVFLCAERLRRLVESTEFVFHGQSIRVTISAGVASLVEHNFTSPEDLVRAADQQLYRAKEQGRNRVCSAEL